MPDVGQLVITLRKNVPDAATARALLLVVKQRFEDHPEINVVGSFTSHFVLEGDDQ